MKKVERINVIMRYINNRAHFTLTVLELGPKAIAQSKKYHPLKISISYTNPFQSMAILKTPIHVHDPDGVAEITNWLLFLGRDIKIRKVPKEVVENMRESMVVLGNS